MLELLHSLGPLFHSASCWDIAVTCGWACGRWECYTCPSLRELTPCFTPFCQHHSSTYILFWHPRSMHLLSLLQDKLALLSLTTGGTAEMYTKAGVSGDFRYFLWPLQVNRWQEASLLCCPVVHPHSPRCEMIRDVSLTPRTILTISGYRQ